MDAFFNKIYANNRLAVLFLFGISLFFFIGLGFVHLFDWDEINFAETAREMIQSGDYMRVQINYIPFWEKPPLFFWMQVIAMKTFGITEFAARFPNAVFGFIYLVTFYFIGKKHFSAKFGMLWALVFFGSLLPHIYFKSGIIDPSFNYFIFLSIYFMLLVIGKSEKHVARYAVLSGVFSGLSVLAKGPVGFLLLGLTLLVYLVIKKFKPFPQFKYILFFLLGFVLVVTSWLSVEFYQNGTENMIQFIEYQLGLFGSDIAGHKQPFYYHFVVVFFGCFPMSILALPSIRRKIIDTPFDLRTWMLCLFWVVMILFSLTTTKIIHYSSMAYIPLAFFATLFLIGVLEKKVEVKKALRITYLVIGLIVGTLIALLPLVIKYKELIIPYINDPFAVDSLNTPVYWSGFEAFIGVFFIVAVIFSYIHLKNGRAFKAVVTSSGGLAITVLCILFFILPKIEAFTQGPAIAMYQELKDKDCYIETRGFKSYAQFYYGETESKQMDIYDMLVAEEIDKPIYLITKSNNDELDTYPAYRYIKTEGGFKLYVREN
ncbi:MAG: glycosyltransferase family 39 protein [Crocinitomicaceae bacterium]|nr:glycosyltransferase family 39 protein [Crocinitomicaceae bacterium]